MKWIIGKEKNVGRKLGSVCKLDFEKWDLLSKIDADLNANLLLVLSGLKKKDESFAIRLITYIYKTDLNLDRAYFESSYTVLKIAH